jgi:queuosine precursor transporter
MRNRIGLAALIGYTLTIPAANWALGNIGTPQPFGPNVIPVGFGLFAPSGVPFAGLAFWLRDVVQDTLGKRWSLAGIVIGALLSWWVSDPALAVASAAAFGLSELLDFAVYTPIRKYNIYLAVALSNTVGLMVDSAVFLFLAFGSLDFLAGQVVGKTWMTLLALAIIVATRRRAVEVA